MNSANIGIRDGVGEDTVCSLIEALGGTVGVGQGIMVGVITCRFRGGLEGRGILGEIVGFLAGASVCNPVGRPEGSIVGHSVRKFVGILPRKLERI